MPEPHKSKAVFTLDVPDDELFVLGIACHFKMYRLLHELTKVWEYEFIRPEDWQIATPAGTDYFSRCHYYAENQNESVFVLVKNKGTKHYLAPKHRQFDFLLCSFDQELLDEIKQTVNSVKHVLATAKIPEKNVVEELVFKLSADLL